MFRPCYLQFASLQRPAPNTFLNIQLCRQVPGKPGQTRIYICRARFSYWIADVFRRNGSTFESPLLGHYITTSYGRIAWVCEMKRKYLLFYCMGFLNGPHRIPGKVFDTACNIREGSHYEAGCFMATGIKIKYGESFAEAWVNKSFGTKYVIIGSMSG